MRKKLWIQISLPIIGIITVIMAVFVVTINSYFISNNNNQIKSKSEANLNAFNKDIKRIEKKALSISSTYATQGMTDSAYRHYFNTKDLESSVEILKTNFVKINKITIDNINEQIRIQYHLAPAQSFFRSWTDKRGDDLSSFRNTVLEVTKTNSAARGIELGRSGLVIRGVSPIRDSLGNCIGSVESFFSIKDLIKQAKQTKEDEFAIYLNKGLVNIADKDFSMNIKSDNITTQNYTLTSSTSENFKTDIISDKIIAESLSKNTEIIEGNYAFSVNYLKDFSGKTIGVIVYQLDITESNSVLKKLNLTILFIGISVLIILSLVIILLSNRIITKPITKIETLLKNIGEGELNTEFKVTRKDEIGQLQLHAKNMVNNLSKIIVSVNQSSSYVSAASNELSTSSQTMSQGSNETASTAEEVSSTMEQMQSNIQQNAQNAKITEKISSKAAVDIATGSKAVKQTVVSMKTITDKISIINEIAFQTNILALNAAVEAARVGDEGKGFAVVAGEIKSLAERSRSAAEEIDKIAISSVAVAENSGSMLAAIVPDIIKTAQLVKEISVSSAEQNLSAKQVSNAIDQLSRVTQQSSAISEEVASSAEELASQAEHLKMTISFFKVDDNMTYDQSPINKLSQPTVKSTTNQDGYQMDLPKSVNDESFDSY